MSDDTHISIPVPPQTAAWRAVPPERRASYARAIVEAWLEPLTRLPQKERTLVPYCTTDTQHPHPDTPRSALEARSDDDLATLIHQAEARLEARWPDPPLTADSATLCETDRQHPETNAALYDHDVYRWCAQTAHLARQVAADDLGWGEDVTRFPATCPWSVEQIRNDNFWPEGASL